jgi:PAS domain S-box-containing protein
VGTSLAAEPLLALAVTVTSEQRVESVLQSIVQGLAAQPGMALARIWLLPSADLPDSLHAVPGPPDHLCLAASAGTPINSPGEDWSFLQGHFARMAFNKGKVGQVAASRRAILVEDVGAQNDWVVRPEWAKREGIRSFAGHPLIFRDKLLGVVGVFSREPLGQQEFTWLGLFANQAALAIANARAEEAVQSTKRNLAAIINTIPTTAWTTRPDGYCDFLNQVWLDYAGMSAEQAQGWGWAEAIHTDDRKRLVEEWQSCLAAGTQVDTEARIRRFDGSYRWFLIRANPLRDESGNILKWYGTCVDIEDRKRGEEALRTRELSWRQIVDNIPGLVATTGAMGEVEFLNRQTLEYFGKTNEELKDWALIDALHPDDLPHVIEARKKSLEQGQIYEVEHRCRRADGVYRWFQVRGSPVRDTEGTISAWYLLLTDIDDRKRAEEALHARELDARSRLDNMPGFLGRHSPDGTPEIVNRPFLEYYGKTLEDVQKWETSELVHPDDLARTVEVFGNGISSGQPWGIEFRLRRFDGIYHWFQARWVPVRDVEGRILHWNALTTDIEDRKHAEQALESSQRDLSIMIDAIPGMIHTARPDGYLDYFNRRWLEYIGCSLSDVEGWKWTSWIHPDDLQSIVDKWRGCVASGEIFEQETRVRRSDGQYRWMFHRKVPLRDEHGNIVRWYGTSLDIEDRKRAEEALRQSEARAHLMVDSIDGQIMTATPTGEVEFVNQQVLDYFGKGLEELKDWRTNNAVHPEDFPRAMALWSHSVETGDPYQSDERLRRADGAYRWFRVRGRCVRDPQGQIVRWYVLLTDVDEGKRAEAQVEQAYLRLAEAQRLSKTGSFITDLVAEDHNWSEEAFRIFEFEPSTKVTVQMVRDCIHPDDLPSFDAVIARGMMGGDVDFVFRIVTSQGAVKHIRGMARVMTQMGRHPLFIGAFQDVTESKIAEEALDRARSELAHVARVTTLNALTASIAHEVNQPLSGIVTNASTCMRMLAADPPNVEGARETVRRTLRDGQRASDVISRLRALFSKKEFTLEPMDVNDSTREVVALSLNDLQRNRVILRSELADDLPPVSGDRVQLQQVILNLVRNACDAMSAVDDRPRELLIRTERVGGDHVRVTVKDVGVGFPREAADKLFQPFYTTKRDGMGIGLSVSQSIIEAHHGRLWAEPNDGPGAIFSFCIPCQPESAAGAGNSGRHAA